MGNVRGTTYSRNHTRLSVWDPAFWAFTWDELGGLDLPTMIAKELEVTGAEHVGYVGHSQVKPPWECGVAKKRQHCLRASRLMPWATNSCWPCVATQINACTANTNALHPLWTLSTAHTLGFAVPCLALVLPVPAPS